MPAVIGASLTRNGCSSRQGTHHEAQTLTSVTRPLKVGGIEARHVACAQQPFERRQRQRRRRLADQRRGQPRRIAGAEAEKEQRGNAANTSQGVRTTRRRFGADMSAFMGRPLRSPSVG